MTYNFLVMFNSSYGSILHHFDIIMKGKIIVTLYIKNVTGALYTVNYNENTLSMSVSVNAAWNSVELTARQNDCSEVAALTDEGRAFQARAYLVSRHRITNLFVTL